jgi:PLD-like domain
MFMHVKYHCEDTFVQALHRLIARSSTCRVAVAYCGEAAHRFFPEAPASRPADLRIIVDASETAVARGLTNPAGLARLLDLPARLRSLRDLHAKAFIFDKTTAIVGSVNMSASSIEWQYQLALEVSDPAIVRQLANWFDARLWKHAEKVDPGTVRKLKGLWRPDRENHPPGRKRKGRLRDWRGEAPQPPLGPSDFSIGIGKANIGRLLSEFKNNECKYSDSGESCLEVARRKESEHAELTKRFYLLMRRRRLWSRRSLEELFDIAYTNGKVAKVHKPMFMRQNPAKVARCLSFLLEGAGDPYMRFEKTLASGSPYKLNGLGSVGVIFLMHLWSPKAFAVVNRPIEDAFKMLKVRFNRPASRRRGQGYKDRTAVVKEIVVRTGLGTFARVDHFLDAIGKGHIGQHRAA